MNERLADAISSLGLSKAAFARALHVTRGCVVQWVSGATKPSPANLALIEEKFGISGNWLTSGEGSPFVTGDTLARQEALRSLEKLETIDLIALAAIAERLPKRKGVNK